MNQQRDIPANVLTCTATRAVFSSAPIPVRPETITVRSYPTTAVSVGAAVCLPTTNRRTLSGSATDWRAKSPQSVSALRLKTSASSSLSQGFEELLSSSNILNRKLEEVLGMTKEYETIASLWSSFHELMRGQKGDASTMEEQPPGLPGTGGHVVASKQTNEP